MSLVLFDLDGTLVDTAPAFTAAWRRAAPSKGGRTLDSGDLQRIIATERTYEAVFHRLGRAAGGASRDDTGAEIARRLEEAFRATYPTDAKLYPGVYRLLMALEDRTSCAVVGSASAPLLEEMVDYFGLEGYVAHTYSLEQGADVSVGKIVAEWHGKTRSTSLENAVWVSSRTFQLELARREGIQTAFASYGYGDLPEWQPAHRLDRLSHLFRIFPPQR